MAAATGYGDAPTGEQLAAYTDLPSDGRDMVEVFAVRVPDAAEGGRPPPCGTIMFYGGHCCSGVIYSRDEPTSSLPCDSQGYIMLTGPSVATSAYGPVIFNLHLHDGTQKGEDDENTGSQEEEEGINTGRIFCDLASGDFSDYNKAIVSTVNTQYGPAEVTYAVLTNAVQGKVDVKLLSRRDDEHAAGVLGRVVARSKLLDAGCVLFFSESGGSTLQVGSSEGLMIPLARRVLAVPLHMPLVIELDLRSSSGDEIVRCNVEFNPATDGENVERVIGVGGDEIQVTISWSDFPW